MSRTEIYQALKAKGIFDINRKDDLWDKAFSLYYKETKVRLSQGCGGCWPRIRRWLQG